MTGPPNSPARRGEPFDSCLHDRHRRTLKGWIADCVVREGTDTVLKVMVLHRRKHGLATRDFIDYYEHHHAPLVTGKAPPPLRYHRNYVTEDLLDFSPDPDFDIIVELLFPDRVAYREWRTQVYAVNSGVAADEMNFLDRSKT